ncbi:hypothetical protein GCM10020219_000100 [Nonomuraea dietziae]
MRSASGSPSHSAATRDSDSSCSPPRPALGPLPRGEAGHQGGGLLRRQDVELEGQGSLPRHEPVEAPAPRHHDAAASRAGQQRPDLRGARRVVEQDQHPPVVQQAPVERRALLEPRRQAGDAERVAEAFEHVGGVQRGGLSAQVHVELAVG